MTGHAVGLGRVMNGVPVKPFQNDWNRKYIPSRGLLYSFLVHELVFFACFSYSILSLPKNQLITPDQELHAAELVYLPNVGGGDQGGSQGTKSREGEGDRSESGPKKAGVVFRGPQFIRSNPAHPDNHLQTVLQPELVVAPKLNFPMQFPNLVKIAPPKAVEVITPKPDAPKLVAPPTPQLVAKLEPQALSTSLRSEIDHLLPTPPLEAKEKPPVQPMSVVPEKAPVSRPTPPVITADASKGDQSIAVLNAIQITAKPTIMPPGEKLGSFEVSPTGTATASGATTLGPGSAGGVANGVSSNGAGKSETAAVGGSGHGGAKIGAGAGASGTGKGSSPTATGNGSGVGAGTAGKGSGSSGKGIGNGSAGTKGGGAGTGNGIGAGAGTGAGAGPFADLEVIGGAGSGFSGSAPRPAIKASVPRGYDLNIVASGGSGGGLKDFGVFHNEAVYTVYMDVSDVIPGSRSWILQYADYVGSRTTEINLDGPPAPQSMLEPPIATTREAAPAPATSTSGTMTVVTGLINAEGKFTSPRVLQCSTEDRGKQWLATLEKWRFQSASKAGKPTTVRVIIGIPEI
jgi:hypothetical protein